MFYAVLTLIKCNKLTLVFHSQKIIILAEYLKVFDIEQSFNVKRGIYLAKKGPSRVVNCVLRIFLSFSLCLNYCWIYVLLFPRQFHLNGERICMRTFWQFSA